MTTQQNFALALQHHQAGRLREAEALYRQILAVQPDHAEALHHLGLIADQAGHHDLAIEWIRRALVLRPDDAAAHLILGAILAEQGRLDEATVAFRRALELKPDDAAAHNNLGNALAGRSQIDEAVAAYRRALQLKPDYPEAHMNLGIALAGQGQREEAMAAFHRALKLQPNYAKAHYNLGNALRNWDQFEEAAASYQRALQLKPNYPDTHNNLGVALIEQGNFDEATAACRQALHLNPDFVRAKFNLAFLLLLHGDYELGWPLYEARWEALHYAKRHFAQPRWDGSMLDGQRVLLHAEQGSGDSIHFIRYAPLIAARGGKVIVECQRTLVELFRTVNSVSEVVAIDDALPPFDLHLPMLSQPLAFQTTRETIPPEVPYLFADSARREIWRRRLGDNRSHLRVGVSWAGNPEQARDRFRSLPLHHLLPLLEMEGVEFFNLQKGHGTAEIEELPGTARIIDHTAHIEDFADTAAFVAELDLIVSVDTAVAHLAGALGRPVWILLSFVADWRWGLENEQNPWYPTMRLFRQPVVGDWGSAIQRVRVELDRLAGENDEERTGKVANLDGFRH